MKKILVVVDMQNDFITGPLGTPEAVGIVDNVVEKIRGVGEESLIVCTFDTHNNKYEYTQEYGKLPVKHCVYKTKGWELDINISNVLYNKSPVYVTKPTFGCLNLVRLINDYTIRYGDIEVTLVGVCTDICVISNALLLKAHFPEMKIVVDASCCAGSSPEKHYAALEVMKSCQIDVINNEWDEIRDNIVKKMNRTFGKKESED